MHNKDGNISGQPAAERVGVLVLGMHRSGTSALTRVLNLLGCDLPATLMGPASSNEVGHWESVAIMELNNEILQSAGTNWHDWLEFNPGWYSSPKAAEFKDKALTVLENEFGHSRLFVVKDPRISRFVPFWLDVLDAAGVQPAIIDEVRNPLEVAESLSQRDGIDPALGHLLWLRYVLEAEAGSRGRPRFHASYERLLNEWSILASEMQEALDISWPRLSAMASEEINDFLTKGLRHHVESTKSVSGNPLLSAWLRDAFAIFDRWVQDGESEADYMELDRIRAELNGAAPAFAQLILSGWKRAKDLQAAQHRIDDQREKLENLAAEQQALTEAGVGLDNDLKSARLERDETRSELSRAEAALTLHVTELEESRRALSEAQTALTRSKAELDGMQGELSQTQSALAQRSAEADEVTAQLHTARDEIVALTRTLQEKEAEVSATLKRSREETTSLERRVAEAEQAREEEAEHAKRLGGALDEERRHSTAELQKLRAEKGAIEGRLAERFSEIAVLTRLLGDKESAAKASDEQLARLRDVSVVLLNGSNSRSLKGRLARLLPEPIRLRKQKARLKRTGIFDPDAYLDANPDVAEAGLDPLWHYINHGITEGRPLTSQHTPVKE